MKFCPTCKGGKLKTLDKDGKLVKCPSCNNKGTLKIVSISKAKVLSPNSMGALFKKVNNV